jgi:hypothetical protein
MKDFQVTEEVAMPQKKTSRITKHGISSLYFYFACLDPDPDIN